MKRVRLKPAAGGGNYFSQPITDVKFIYSGCKMLDLALGGGWAEGRIINIVGDKSSGKTLLCIEASANFAAKYKNGRIRYRESERAFQPDYAKALGMPLDRVDFGDKPLETVEDLFEDLQYYASKAKGPELYICDSLDALSDRAEMVRDMDTGTYGAVKAKKLSEMFRRVVRHLEEASITLIIVSQIRSKIGISFGRTTSRTGGRALDFYASQVLFLAQTSVVTRTISNIKRAVGIEIKAKVDKNKVALPFREAEFEITFGYGVNDIRACLAWLKQGGFLGDIGLTDKAIKVYERDLMNSRDRSQIERLHSAVQTRWYELESRFLPTRKKYG